jgi:hypothetical protein
VNATPSNYDIATSQLDAIAPIDSGSFDASRTTVAQIHALLAIADEVRQLREEIVIVTAAITGPDSDAGGLRRVLEHMERMDRRQPD